MSATMTASKEAKRTPVPMNGIDTPTLFATINAVGAQPELGKFQFRAKSRWLSGTHSESTMHGFFGAGGEHTHVAPYTAEGDHPTVLTGADAAPSPVEWVLHALASCLTAGIGTDRGGTGDQTQQGRVDGRGRHRSARRPRALGRRPQRLPGHQGFLRDRWRRKS